MSIKRDDVRDRVIESLILVLGNKEVPIDEQTDPMGGLGLDSEDGVDFACTLSDKLNYEIPDRINPLVDDERHRPRRVGEITDLVCKLLTERKEESNG
jgi:acyl carrier protein